MQYCPKCKIKIAGNKSCCPLCQGNLNDDGNEAVPSPFPVISRRFSRITFIKIVTFIITTFIILTYLLTWISGEALPWLSTMRIGAVFLWLDILLALYLRNNILKVLTIEGFILLILNFIIDWATGWIGWSVAWVTPSTLLILGIVTFTIARVTRLHADEYIAYLLLDSLAAILQFIPIRLERTPITWPAFTIIALYLILDAGVVIFRFRDLRSALERRFNL